MVRATMGDCGICCEKYNRQSHKKVDCYFCEFSSCRTCVQTYLLNSTNDPHCMSCKNAWNREFVDQSCTKVFRNKDLKNHREQILLEREKCLLPQTQELVARKKQEINIRKLIENTQSEIVRVVELQTDLKNQLYRLQAGHSIDDTPKKNFVRKCPMEECKGFLSSDWKCGLCSSQICSKCNEQDEGEDHVCDPNNVETVKLLKKDTKPCPSCGTMIFKISGCSQMWCPECHTAFNWASGRIETGIIHNPHFYEFQRRVGGGQANRNPGDIPCGGMPNVGEIVRFFHPEVTNRHIPLYGYRNYPRPEPTGPLEKQLTDLHRCVNHAQAYEIPQYTDIAVNNSDLRVQYLMDLITEEGMKRTLQTREKAREKTKDISDVLRMFCDTSGDYFRQLLVKEVTTEQCLEILVQLKQYFNSTMEVIHKRYNCVTPYIVGNDYRMIHWSYKA